MTSTTIATIRSARPPKAPADTAIIIVTFGPGFGETVFATFDCEGVGVAPVVVVARVDCEVASTELGRTSVLVGTGGSVVVVEAEESEVVDSWVVVLVGVAEMEEEEEGADVIEEVGDAVALRLPLAVELLKVEPGIERSNGGLYSKVLVASSVILKPYLSPFGIAPLSCSELGMFHVKVPSLLMDAAIGPRSTRLLGGPLRRFMVIVPWVLGVQVIVRGALPSKEPPSGYVIAFCPLVPCANAPIAPVKADSTAGRNNG